MFKLILALVAVSALAADIEAPIISLNLNHGSESNTAHASSSNFADECCNGVACDGTSSTVACELPVASAYDHHDGDISGNIEIIYSVFVESEPGSDPDQVTGDATLSAAAFTNKITPTLSNGQANTNYDAFRGEFVLNYDVLDSAGNSAETVTYALIMRDTEAPTYMGGDLDQSALYGEAANTFASIPLSSFVDTYDGSYVSVDFTHSGTVTTIASSAANIDTTSAFAVPLVTTTNGFLCAETTATAVVIDYADIFGQSNQDNANTYTFTYSLSDDTPPAIAMAATESDMISGVECHGGVDTASAAAYPYGSGASATDLSCNCMGSAGTTLDTGAGACKTSCTSAFTFGLTSTAVGSVIVTCQAEDFHERTHTSSSSAIVIVDTTPPVLTLGTDTLSHMTTQDGSDGAQYTSYYNISAADNFEHSSTIQHSAGYLQDATDIENLKNFYTCVDTCTATDDLVVTSTWHKATTSADNCDSVPNTNTQISIVDVGTYLLKYVCTDQSGNTDHKCRTILNQDHTIPILNFIAEGNNMGPCSNDCTGVPSGTGNYVDEGATCSDTVDGVISELVEVSGDVVSLAVIGTYHITYDCTDSAGNEATSITRTVKVYDDVCPTCAIDAYTHAVDETLTIEASFPYSDDAVTCTDNLDFPAYTLGTVDHSAALTKPASVTGEVDVELTGEYVLSYHATDGAGNTNFATAEGVACNTDIHQSRTVLVQDTLKPIITLKDQMTLMEESSSVNGWLIGAIASAVAGVAIVGFSESRKATVATSVPV